ncbi:uncharacterized protein LOC127586716 isoform X2 [Pristis pectinata]|uniref:uncharacterized protein LOC127586716 isoform X2 n=1 Tax=Pristis pectinata TaxID=685728 RepID=UPI00223E0A94|nr:uncharacterized protein LOC127586716 isoform X2 [Pristis pectinata]
MYVEVNPSCGRILVWSGTDTEGGVGGRKQTALQSPPRTDKRCPCCVAPRAAARMGQVRVIALARRKIRVGLLVLLTAVAISLATFSLVVAALSWVEFRNLSRSLQGWGDHGQQGEKSAALETIRPNPPTRLGFLQALLSSKAVLRKRRERSRGTGSGPKHRAVVAAHFEVPSVTDNGIYIVEKGGIIRQWAERSFQARPRPLSYKQHDGRDSR